MLHRFADFELDERAGLLRAPGDQVVELGSRDFELLCYLVRHRDRIISREELLDAVWPDVLVSDASLSTAIRHLRRALGESSGDDLFIRTLPRRGYRFLPAVQRVEAEQPPVAAADGPKRDAKGLLGRQAHRTQLRTMVTGLLEGRGRFVALLGPAGIGKASLSDEAAAEAVRLGVDVVQVRCDVVAGAPALWAFVLVLRQLLRVRSAASHARREVGDHDALRQVLAQLHASESATPDSEPGAGRFRLFDAVTAALLDAAHRRPLLLVLHDMHRADASSHQLLASASNQLASSPLGVIASYAGSVSPRGNAAVLRLEPLDDLAAGQLVQQVAGRPLGADCVRSIVASAGGNPLLLRELAQLAARQTPSDGDEPPPGWQAQLPASLRNVVARRLEQVSVRCRRALQIASCMGDEFGSRQLAVYVGADRPALSHLLQEAVDVGLVSAQARTPSRYRFVHGAFREVIYESLESSERPRVHRLIADRIAHEHGVSIETVGGLIHHSGAAADDRSSVHYRRLAADGAAAIGAHDTAIEHLSRAQVAADHSLSSIDTAERVELQLRMAGSRGALDGDDEQLRTMYRHAFELARDLGSPELQARAALGFSGCQLLRGTAVAPAPPLNEELKLLEQARRVQAPAGLWRALLEARLAAALGQTDRVEEAAALSAGAVRMAERLGDSRTLCEALLQRARALSGVALSEQRLAAAGEALLVARDAGLGQLEGDARFELAAARLRAGRLSGQQLAHLCEVGEGGDDPMECLRRRCWGIVRAHAGGQLDLARRLLAEVSKLASAVNPIAAKKLLPTLQWHDGWLRGLPQSLPRLHARTLSRYKPALWMGYAWLSSLIDQNDLRRARWLHGALSPQLHKVADNQHWLQAIASEIWACHVLGDPKAAERAYTLLRPFAGMMVTSVDSLVLHSPVDHYLGCAAMVLGQHDMADEHFAQAIAQAERLEVSVPALVTRRYRALLRIQQGQGSAGRRESEAIGAELLRLGLRGPERHLRVDLERLT
ncbi:MAG: winged helix-turn-helix domain-containing protein [Myxococcales bacterium]|nr:winged helix-turn-helix domain-containing protein [Myxococcales bacterium]